MKCRFVGMAAAVTAVAAASLSAPVFAGGGDDHVVFDGKRIVRSSENKVTRRAPGGKAVLAGRAAGFAGKRVVARAAAEGGATSPAAEGTRITASSARLGRTPSLRLVEQGGKRRWYARP